MSFRCNFFVCCLDCQQFLMRFISFACLFDVYVRGLFASSAGWATTEERGDDFTTWNNASTRTGSFTFAAFLCTMGRQFVQKRIVLTFAHFTQQAYDHQESAVRKASVFNMVAIHNVVGDDMKAYLTSLNGSKMKLLKLYIERSKAQSSGCSSPISQASVAACWQASVFSTHERMRNFANHMMICICNDSDSLCPWREPKLRSTAASVYISIVTFHYSKSNMHKHTMSSLNANNGATR